MFIFISERLKKRRQALNLTLRELADRSGIDHTALSRFESGDRDPGTSGLGILADALGVTPNYFYEKEMKS